MLSDGISIERIDYMCGNCVGFDTHGTNIFQEDNTNSSKLWMAWIEWFFH